MIVLREYQQQLYQKVRESFRKHKAVFMQLHCGGGKTAIFSTMAAAAKEKGSTVWICLPRKELLDQACNTLSVLDVPHGRIDAGTKESNAFALHIVSSNTLVRRWDKIKNKPDFIIIDEGHLFFDRQVEIHKRYPDSRILAVSASPERLDGRGLAQLYGTLVEGPTMAWMVDNGYSVPFKYFAPPIEGLDKIKKTGWDYDENDLSALFEARKLYGNAVEKYEQHAPGKTALAFARSVKEAEKIAINFEAAGYKFLPISGKTKGKERTLLIEALRKREIDGLVNCEIATYGLDVPPIECLIMLRPTTSRALFTQMIGRGSRPYDKKTECVVLDHVSNLQEFGHPLSNHKWNFEGRKRIKRVPDEKITLRLCPDTFMYCTKATCTDCNNNKKGRISRVQEVVDCELKEFKSPIKLSDRPPELKREFQDRLDMALAKAKLDVQEMNFKNSPHIEELLKICNQIGRSPIWAYWKLCSDKNCIQVSLLHELARQSGFKSGWVWHQKKEIEKKLKKRRESSVSHEISFTKNINITHF